MARIPESEIERLKSAVSLERLAEARGVKLVRRGKDLFGRCPFHDDRTPSLVISPETNLWHCLGACQVGGSVIDWVMRAEGVSFRHAVELLRGDLPVATEAPSFTASGRRRRRELIPNLASTDVEDQVLLRKVVGYYHESLKESPGALEYLQGRGLKDAAMLAKFQIGYADRTLAYRLPRNGTKEGTAMRSRLKELGVLRRTGHEHLRGSIVIPLFDGAGRLVQMYGRKVAVDSNLREGTPRHLYLPGPQRGVFNREALRVSPEVILCESLIDALSFWCAGFRNVTSTYGTSGMTTELWEAFREASTKRVLIAFDRDQAGERAATKLAGELTQAGMAAYRVELPKGMDVNEYATKVTPASRSLGAVVRGALWLGEGQAPEREATQAPVPAAPALPSEPEPEPEPEAEAEAEAKTKEGPVGKEAEEAAEEEAGGGPAEPASPEAEDLPEAQAQAEAPPQAEPQPDPPPRPAPLRVPTVPEPDRLERRGEESWLRLGDRSYRVRGLEQNLKAAVMKVNLLVRRELEEPLPGGAGFHVDTLDLYLARPREGFARRAAVELGCEEATVARDLGRLLLALEAAVDETSSQAPASSPGAPALSDTEREEALALLRSPDLLGEILRDFERCGVVGEETNKLAGYLAAVSRKLERPLAIVVQSNSAAGKSSLMEAVLAFMPEEEQVSYSAMTGQSLYYMSGSDLRHKILAIAEEEGAQRASYALKLLQSEGRLKIASTGKDPTTGRLVTEDYEVEGPVMIFLTTTATDVDEELMNRCLVLAVDEGRAQTEAIHREQRVGQTLEGKLRRRQRQKVLRRHRNAQRLLRPLLVHNPFAERLTFLGHQTRFRRDHQKYLSLIETVALLHQHQRERKVHQEGEEVVEYIEVTREDLVVANRLAHEILGRSVDELPPQTRRFLEELTRLVAARGQERGIPREEVRFTRREVREWTGLANGRVHVHLTRLEELEYVLVHSGRRGKSLVYELLYESEGETQAPFFPGLLEVDEEGAAPEYGGNLSALSPQLSAPKAHLPAPFLPAFRPNSGGFPPPPEGPEAGSGSSLSSSLAAEIPESPPDARRGRPEIRGAVPQGRGGTNGTEPPGAA